MERTPYVDQEVCIGCGVCVELVPDVFRMTEEQLAEVFDPRGAPEETIREAMEACPVSCIHWE